MHNSKFKHITVLYNWSLLWNEPTCTSKCCARVRPLLGYRNRQINYRTSGNIGDQDAIKYWRK